VIETFAGQVIVGGTLSITVTLKLQVAAARALTKPDPTNSEQLTVVVPKGKNDPGGGAQIIPKHEPEVVGSG
jgi:hypothetical protein